METLLTRLAVSSLLAAPLALATAATLAQENGNSAAVLEEVMVTATTTASIAAVVSVTGTLAAKTVFDYLLKLIKPTLKIAVNKLAKARGKPTTSWARQRLQERRHK